MTDNMIKWELGADRVLVLTMDDPTSSANTMNKLFGPSLGATVERLEAEKDTFDGVIITSAKSTFFAGADLEMLMNAGPADVKQIADALDYLKDNFRRIETLGKPVVAAINGVALGGGFEIALAAHHRVLLDGKGTVVGLPEVSLGVLPGAGGVTRITRMLGVVQGFLKVISQGTKHKPAAALSIGIVDQVVSTREEMFAAARAFIAANPDATQPWDRKGFRIPGGTPSVPSFAANLPAIPANVRKQLKGSPMPAPISALAAAVEGSQVDFATASKIETRYCADLICGKVSGNMIKAFFFDLNSINKGASRPKGFPVRRAEKVAVLGAGMMGAAIAYVTAQSGAQVVLRDITIEAAERGKSYSQNLLDKAVAKGRITQEKRDEVLGRILATDNIADIKGCDFVVEAVFEDIDIKKKVFGEIQDLISEDALIATNTSALPLKDMVGSIARPEDFIGLHFFSPVDKMPLLEIVVGENTSDEAVARAFDFAQQIKKTPIAVKDVYAFYANRVIGEFIEQATSLLAEGAHPASIEQAATQAGFPVGPLALLDEVNMKTTLKIQKGWIALAEAEGGAYKETPGTAIQPRMVEEFDRPGRLFGRGFYDYAENGTRLGLWPRLITEFHKPEVDIPFVDMKERMLIGAALEAARCYDSGIVKTVADANIGSVFGIGFPAWTGGTLQYINQHEGGLAGFIARADELRGRYGDRFEVPASLRAKAQAGEILS